MFGVEQHDPVASPFPADSPEVDDDDEEVEDDDEEVDDDDEEVDDNGEGSVDTEVPAGGTVGSGVAAPGSPNNPDTPGFVDRDFEEGKLIKWGGQEWSSYTCQVISDGSTNEETPFILVQTCNKMRLPGCRDDQLQILLKRKAKKLNWMWGNMNINGYFLRLVFWRKLGSKGKWTFFWDSRRRNK